MINKRNKEESWGRECWGMTLTELLVSTALIGIVMLGVVSVEYASKRSQENMSRKSIVTTRTSAMLLHIVKNAALAVGDVIDVGIRIRTTGGINSRYACFRQDIPQTPGNYSDDTWVCYTRRTTNKVHTCNRTSPGACTSFTTTLGTATALSVTYTADRATQTNRVDISITSLYDDSAPFDPDGNPRVIMTAQVNPTGQSFF